MAGRRVTTGDGPQVEGGYLLGTGERIAVDSPAWFAWLQEPGPGHAFTFPTADGQGLHRAVREWRAKTVDGELREYGYYFVHVRIYAGLAGDGRRITKARRFAVGAVEGQGITGARLAAVAGEIAAALTLAGQVEARDARAAKRAARPGITGQG